VFPVTSVPDQVPPGVPVTKVFKLTAGEFEQSEVVVQAAVLLSITAIWMVSVAPHAPDIVYVTTLLFPDNPEGLNEFPETPTPVQVPPVLAAVKVTGGAFEHKVEIGLIVAFAIGVTVMLCVEVEIQGAEPTV
jgi:hypothetical protein